MALPITFSYYASDFEDVEAFVLAHAEPASLPGLQRAFDSGYRIVYDRYDWSLNSM